MTVEIVNNNASDESADLTLTVAPNLVIAVKAAFLGGLIHPEAANTIMSAMSLDAIIPDGVNIERLAADHPQIKRVVVNKMHPAVAVVDAVFKGDLPPEVDLDMATDLFVERPFNNIGDLGFDTNL